MFSYVLDELAGVCDCVLKLTVIRTVGVRRRLRFRKALIPR